MQINLREVENTELFAGDIILDDNDRILLIVEDTEHDEFPIKLIDIKTGYVVNAISSYEHIDKAYTIKRHILSSRLQLTES